MADPAEVKAKLRAAFRDFRVDGVPSSGANEPVKREVRAGLDAAIDLAAQSTVTKAVATKADLASIPSPAVGDSARVMSDPLGDVADGNGVWSWSGSAWAWVGPWVDPVVSDGLQSAQKLRRQLGATTASKNLFNRRAIIAGTAINATTGALTPNASWYTSDLIPVTGGATYTVNKSSHYLAQYKASGAFISRTDHQTGSGSKTITLHPEAAFVRLMIVNGIKQIQFEAGAVATAWEPFGDTLDQARAALAQQRPLTVTLTRNGGQITTVTEQVAGRTVTTTINRSGGVVSSVVTNDGDLTQTETINRTAGAISGITTIIAEN